MTMGVYQIKCLVTGDCYIGSSRNIKQRWKSHQWAIRNKRHHSPKFQEAWIQYGGDAFEFTILEDMGDGKYWQDWDKMRRSVVARERYFITKLRPAYNIR